MKIYSASQAIREMQIKTTMISPHTSQNSSRQKEITSVGENVEKKEPL